jgi:myo-inositol-1(or 4)-monophosphatase
MNFGDREGVELIAWLKDRLRTAGSLILDRYGTARVSPKGARDLVTDVDTEVEAWLVKEISVATPDWQVVAEEGFSGSRDVSTGRWWILDPLDGTLNYALGVPFFAVSLALLEDGCPVLGGIFDPLRDELFEAILGGGARLNGEPIAVSPQGELDGCLAVSSGFLEILTGEGCGPVLRRLLASFPKIRNLGAEALHLSYVACGRFQGSASVEARIWDDAAGALIAIEAGARYTGFDGRPLFPARAAWNCLKNIAAEQGSHSRILELLAELDEGGCDR